MDQIDFNNFDLVAIIHPGLGQDFKLPFLEEVKNSKLYREKCL